MSLSQCEDTWITDRYLCQLVAEPQVHQCASALWWIEQWHLSANAVESLCPTVIGSLLSGDVECGRAAGMAPSEANRPHGQRGHMGLCLGYIWAAGCPLSTSVGARVSWKSSCHICCRKTCHLFLKCELLIKSFELFEHSCLLNLVWLFNC